MGIGMPSHYSSSVNSNRGWRKYLRSDQSIFFFYQICFQLTCTNTCMQNMHTHLAEVGFLGCPLLLLWRWLCASPGVQIKEIPPSAKTMSHNVQKKKKEVISGPAALWKGSHEKETNWDTTITSQPPTPAPRGYIHTTAALLILMTQDTAAPRWLHCCTQISFPPSATEVTHIRHCIGCI